MSKVRENYHLKAPGKTYRKTVTSRIEEVGAKTRKDSVLMQDGLITATPEWIGGKTKAEQRAFFEYAYDFLKERYGEENMISCVVHMDEKTPHMHFVFVPITKDGRLSSKEIIGGPAGMRALQDTFYEYMSKRYPDLERGIPARETGRKHIPTYMFKTVNRLKEHQQEIEEAVRDIGILGNREKREHALELLEKYAPEMLKVEHHLETTNKYVSQLEERIDQDRNEIRSLEQRNRNLNSSLSRKFQAAYEDQETIIKLEKQLGETNVRLIELNRDQKMIKKILDQIPREVYERITGEKGKEPAYGPYSRKEKEQKQYRQQQKKEPVPKDRTVGRPQRHNSFDEYER